MERRLADDLVMFHCTIICFNLFSMKKIAIILLVVLIAGCSKEIEQCKIDDIISSLNLSGVITSVSGMPFEIPYSIEVLGCEKYNELIDSELTISFDSTATGNFVEVQKILFTDSFINTNKINNLLSITLYQSGDYRFTLCTDINDKITEIDESNNCH